MRLISAITRGYPAEVTTTFDHDYVDGMIVRLYIPQGDGMQQLDRQVAEITVTGSTTFTIPVDTTSFDAFAIPGSPSRHTFTCAQVVPVGQSTNALAATTRNVLG